MNYERCIKWQGFNLTLQIGKVAHMADGSVLVRYGDTVVLVTTVIEKHKTADIDFLPLSVHYIEKAYAAGKIPGGFFKREGKPNEHETLKARLIDRAVRPLLPDNLQNEVQVIITVLAYDSKVGTMIPSLIGTSCSLMVSGLPFKGPLAAVRVCHDGESFFTSHDAQTACDVYVAGTKNRAVTLEVTGKEFSSKTLMQAVKYAFCAYKPVIDLLEDVKKSVKIPQPHISLYSYDPECYRQIEKKRAEIESALFIPIKKERRSAIHKIKSDLFHELHHFSSHHIKRCFDKIEAKIMEEGIASRRKRIDGRDFDEIRPIEGAVSVLPVVHGSCLFKRGETEVLTTLTIGNSDARQSFDELSGYSAQSFLFHYNFPPFCVGEIDKLGAPSRREVGHGYLAWRSLRPMLSEMGKYTLRLVSEVLASNGSSSMASVCSGSLALMNAGIHMVNMVAGLALGYVKTKDEEIILTDILGDEDFFGLMDLKIAGTKKGFTALQMDVKGQGISVTTLQKALSKGRKGLDQVLDAMHKIMPRPEKNMPISIPRIDEVEIGRDRISSLIGKGGKVIRTITKSTNTKIDVSDNGRITISGDSWKSVYAAKKIIRSTVQEPEKGKIYDGKVKEVNEKGILIEFNKYLKGVLRFENGAEEKKALSTLKVGDQIKVQFLSLDRRGDINLIWISEEAVQHQEISVTEVEYEPGYFTEKCDILPEENCNLIAEQED